MRSRQAWTVVAAAAIAVLGVAGSPGAFASPSGGAAKCVRQLIAGKQACLRAGQACRPASRDDYLLAGFECVRRRGKRVLARASLAAQRGPHAFLYDSRGLPTPPDALQAFDEQIAHLPGVRHRRGAVGVGESGTPVIRALSRYRSRLTTAQRKVLDRVTAPRATIAAPLPNSGAFAALRDEALRRLQAHGLRFTHAIGLGYDPNDHTHLAYTNPLWLEGKGNYCQVTITPSGVRDPVDARRASMLHELIHCAQGEAVNTENEWEAIPDWIAEGSANWGAAQVMSEWTRVPAYLIDWWKVWLDQPESDLFKRDYDAMGFFALIQHEGRDPFGLIQPLSVEGGQGSSLAAFGGLLGGFPSLPSAWGPTLATQPALGRDWDLAGPGDPRRNPPSATIADGSSWSHIVSARGGYAARLQLGAQIVKVDLGDPQLQGRLRTSDGNDHVLTSAKYTTVKGDLECPDGTKLDYPKISPGMAYLGFADMRRVAAVGVEGLSVEQACEKAGKVPKPPRNDACQVLGEAGGPGIVGPGAFGFEYDVRLSGGGHGSGCIFYGVKPDPEDPTREEPTGKGASLTLGSYPLSKRRRTLSSVERLLARLGYRRIRIAGADVAGIHTTADGKAVVEMLVGATAAFAGAGSTSDTLALARGVARALR